MIKINLEFFMEHSHREPFPEEIADWEFEDLIDGVWFFNVINEDYKTACVRAQLKFMHDRKTKFGEIHLIGYLSIGEEQC